MVSSVVTSHVVRSTVSAIQKTQALADETSKRLATGKKVNSALDQPQNFFAAQALTDRANDLARLLDGIGLSVRTIEETMAGVEAVEKLLDQAETIAVESRSKLVAGETDLRLGTEIENTSPNPLSQQILSNNPVGYWRLNDAGAVAANLGSAGAALDGTYVGGVASGGAPLYTNEADVSAVFGGTNPERINIPSSPLINQNSHNERTVELVFNANDIISRQVLYEEGGGTNGFTIYVDNGFLRISAEDQGNFDNVNFNAPIMVGETYHVAFVFDRFSNSFEGFLDGASLGSIGVGGQIFPSHGGAVGIGDSNGAAQFHDADGSGNHNFDGLISDVALYNSALSAGEIADHANALDATTTTHIIHLDFEKTIREIDAFIEDASYRGVNLLAKDDLRVDLNEERSNFLKIRGVDFSFEALGIERYEFDDLDNLDTIIAQVREAREEVRDFGTKLANSLRIIDTRLDFTRNVIENHLAGADDLTLADMNEEGANMLANNTRLAMGQNALATASRSQASILQVIGGRFL